MATGNTLPLVGFLDQSDSSREVPAMDGVAEEAGEHPLPLDRPRNDPLLPVLPDRLTMFSVRGPHESSHVRSSSFEDFTFVFEDLAVLGPCLFLPTLGWLLFHAAGRSARTSSSKRVWATQWAARNGSFISGEVRLFTSVGRRWEPCSSLGGQ